MDTILLVDPMASHARRLATVLENAGLRVVHVSSSERAAAAVARLRPALVFIDAFAPEMDGFAVTRAISRDPDTKMIPVVLMAPAPYSAHKVRALWSGAREFLIKPVDSGELLDAVRAFTGTDVREPHAV